MLRSVLIWSILSAAVAQPELLRRPPSSLVGPAWLACRSLEPRLTRATANATAVEELCHVCLAELERSRPNGPLGAEYYAVARARVETPKPW